MRRKKPPAPASTQALVPAPVPTSSALARRELLQEAVRDFAEASIAKNTARARRADWAVFESWCSVEGAAALPAAPETVAAFLVDQAKGNKERKAKAAATVIRYAQSISAVHRQKNFASPVGNEGVQLVIRGIRRTLGARPQRKKDAFSADVAAEAIPKYANENAYAELRDRALVLFGLATAMRESEICSINIEDIRAAPDGFLVELRRSKTDQEGHGRFVAVGRLGEDAADFCAVRAVDAWLEAIGRPVSGPLFRGLLRNGKPKGTRLSVSSVDAIVQRVVAAGGFDAKRHAGHSLRAGYVTTARSRGFDWPTIMEQTGHKTLEAAKRYERYAPDAFTATRVMDVFRGAFKKREK